MIHTDALIIGGGPAGLCAAQELGRKGFFVILAERHPHLGGQLIKQTHMFFGSEKQYASMRGIDICNVLKEKLQEMPNVQIMLSTTILGIYEEGVVTAQSQNDYIKIKPKVIIVATGASEKFLAFPNNDLPGIYGAGAVQTLMNVYGIKPANEVVMLGAGNIGLIVSYQLIQAGVKVKAILDAAPHIGGYLVHASKLARMGIPIMTSTTIKRAIGKEKLKGVEIVSLDEKWNPVANSEKYISCDNLCISVGLTPLTELLWQAGCEMVYTPTLGGYVPKRTNLNQTSVENIFVCGDASGIEEASSAMVGGHIAGIGAAKYLGNYSGQDERLLEEYMAQAKSLRSGDTGKKILEGLEKAKLERCVC
jgi:sarcosine oxidase subunit alpha